jgi:kumamolisin
MLVLRAGASARLDQLGAALLDGKIPPEVGDRSTLRPYFASSPEDIEHVRRFMSKHQLTMAEANSVMNTAIVRGTLSDMTRVFTLGNIPRELVGVVEAVILPDDARAVGYSSAQRNNDPSQGFTPPQLAELYRFPRGSGAGQTIGIVAFAGQVDHQELEAYLAELGIDAPPEVVTVPVAGGAGVSRPWHSDRYELMDNVEVAAAIAPAARIVVYVAPNTTAGFLAALSTAVHDELHRPSVISVSWGQAEPCWAPGVLTAVDRVLRAAALLGITVLCATGDSGSSDGVEDGHPHVDFPASSPFVLACGGTSLRALPAGRYHETAWRGGGGGVSEWFPVPSYQRDVRVPLRGGPTASSGRGVPDVAGHADLAAGYRLRADGRTRLVGGTSLVAPLYAGLVAIVNERAGDQVGFVNGVLYREAGAQPICRDVTSGSNGAYEARRGWDPCTGWGSLNGEALLNACLHAAARRSQRARDPAPPPRPVARSGRQRRSWQPIPAPLRVTTRPRS